MIASTHPPIFDRPENSCAIGVLQGEGHQTMSTKLPVLQEKSHRNLGTAGQEALSSPETRAFPRPQICQGLYW
jgi:hypothetical protein